MDEDLLGRLNSACRHHRDICTQIQKFRHTQAHIQTDGSPDEKETGEKTAERDRGRQRGEKEGEAERRDIDR